MNLTLRIAPNLPLLLPLVPEEPQPFHADAHNGGTIGENVLCSALIQRIAQTHPVAMTETFGMNHLGSHLQDILRQGVTRMLLLPWNMPGATAQIVPVAMNALSAAGSELPSVISLALSHPATVSGVSPAGPLGGLLSQHQRLDRFVEQWPGWKRLYTVIRSEHKAILILHSGKASPLLPFPDRCLKGKHQHLKQCLYQSLHENQEAQEQNRCGYLLQRDSIIYARYLSGIVTAALDALCSLPLLEQG